MAIATAQSATMVDSSTQTVPADENQEPLHQHLMALLDIHSEISRTTRTRLVNTLCFLICHRYGQDLPDKYEFNVIIVRDKESWRMDVVQGDKVFIFGGNTGSRIRALGRLLWRIEKHVAEVVAGTSGPVRDQVAIKEEPGAIASSVQKPRSVDTGTGKNNGRDKSKGAGKRAKRHHRSMQSKRGKYKNIDNDRRTIREGAPSPEGRHE
jgi:hypothetical protein